LRATQVRKLSSYLMTHTLRMKTPAISWAAMAAKAMGVQLTALSYVVHH
jgi:hypothetical protein